MSRSIEKKTEITKERNEGNSSKALDLSRQRVEDERETESEKFIKAKKSIDENVSWFQDKKVQEHIRSVGTSADGFRKLCLQCIEHARYYENCCTTLGNKAFLEPYNECAEMIRKITHELKYKVIDENKAKIIALFKAIEELHKHDAMKHVDSSIKAEIEENIQSLSSLLQKASEQARKELSTIALPNQENTIPSVIEEFEKIYQPLKELQGKMQKQKDDFIYVHNSQSQFLTTLSKMQGSDNSSKETFQITAETEVQEYIKDFKEAFDNASEKLAGLSLTEKDKRELKDITTGLSDFSKLLRLRTVQECVQDTLEVSLTNVSTIREQKIVEAIEETLQVYDQALQNPGEKTREAFETAYERVQGLLKKFATHLPMNGYPDTSHFSTESDQADIEHFIQAADTQLKYFQQLDIDKRKENFLSKMEHCRDNLNDGTVNDLFDSYTAEIKITEEASKWKKILYQKLFYIAYKEVLFNCYAPNRTDRVPTEQDYQTIDHYLNEGTLKKISSYQETLAENKKEMDKFRESLLIEDDNKHRQYLSEVKQQLEHFKQQLEHLDKINIAEDDIITIDTIPEKFRGNVLTTLKEIKSIDPLWWLTNPKRIKRNLVLAESEKEIATIEIERGKKILSPKIDSSKINDRKEYFKDIIKEKEKEIQKMKQIQEFIECFEKNGEQLLNLNRERLKKLEHQILHISEIKSKIQGILNECNKIEIKTINTNTENSPRNEQIYCDAQEIGQRATDMFETLQQQEDKAYQERRLTIERLRIVYKCGRGPWGRLHPFWIPEQMEQDSEATRHVFQNRPDYRCGSSSLRSILAEKNPDYKDEKGKDLPKESASLTLEGGIHHAEIPYLLKKMGHPIPYMDWMANFARNLDDLEQTLNKKGEQGEALPSFVALTNENMPNNHAVLCYGTAWRECKDDEGKSHKVKKLCVGDPYYGKVFWVPFADIHDPSKSGNKIYYVSFPGAYPNTYTTDEPFP